MMRTWKQVLQKNKGLVLFYILLGIVSAFLSNFKADYFQKVVDGLADRSIGPSSILLYGGLLAAGFLVNYLDNYPEQ